jgi:hypothetical protein
MERVEAKEQQLKEKKRKRENPFNGHSFKQKANGHFVNLTFCQPDILST